MYCQRNYEELPQDWILAPDNSNSMNVISLNTWSTKTVIVDSGFGYYSRSSFASLNSGYFLVSNGTALSCAICDCQVLIQYFAPEQFQQPQEPTQVVYSSPPLKSNQPKYAYLAFLVLLPVLVAGALYYRCVQMHRLRKPQVQPLQIQTVTVEPKDNAVGFHQQVLGAGSKIHPYEQSNNEEIIQQMQPAVEVHQYHPQPHSHYPDQPYNILGPTAEHVHVSSESNYHSNFQAQPQHPIHTFEYVRVQQQLQPVEGFHHQYHPHPHPHPHYLEQSPTNIGGPNVSSSSAQQQHASSSVAPAAESNYSHLPHNIVYPAVYSVPFPSGPDNHNN